jgi:hypothetical protein
MDRERVEGSFHPFRIRPHGVRRPEYNRMQPEPRASDEYRFVSEEQ